MSKRQPGVAGAWPAMHPMHIEFPRYTHTNRGLTLVELMVTVAVFAILATIAVPSFSEFVRNSRMVSNTNELVSALHFARSEAVKRNARVTACPSTNGTSCSGNGNWETGWIVFADGGATVGDVDNGVDTVLRVQQAIDGANSDFTIRAAANSPIANGIGFMNDGRAVAANNNNQAGSGTYSLCDSRGTDNNAARGVRIGFGGAINTSTFSGAIQCP